MTWLTAYIHPTAGYRDHLFPAAVSKYYLPSFHISISLIFFTSFYLSYTSHVHLRSRDQYSTLISNANMVLKLSFACWDYDRMKAIEDGRVRPEGIELTFLNYRVEET